MKLKMREIPQIGDMGTILYGQMKDWGDKFKREPFVKIKMVLP
jgi:hypothetical protein